MRPTPVRSSAPVRPPTRRRESTAAYAFDTVSLGTQWELTGGLRWDRFDVDYTSVAVGGAVTPFERTDEMVSWRGGVVYKPRAQRQRLRRLLDGLQSVGRRAVAVGGDRQPRARADAESRSRHQVGCPQRTAAADGGGVPHREDQRAHAGCQRRRSADGARGRAARERRRAGRLGPHQPPVDAAWRLLVHVERHRGVQHPDRGGQRAGAGARAHVQPVDDLRVPVEAHGGRRRAVHGQRVSQRCQLGQRAQLLAAQHAGVVRDQPAPHAAAQRHEPGQRGIRRSHRRRSLHPRAERAVVVSSAIKF